MSPFPRDPRCVIPLLCQCGSSANSFYFLFILFDILYLFDTLPAFSKCELPCIFFRCHVAFFERLYTIYPNSIESPCFLTNTLNPPHIHTPTLPFSTIANPLPLVALREPPPANWWKHPHPSQAIMKSHMPYPTTVVGHLGTHMVSTPFLIWAVLWITALRLYFHCPLYAFFLSS